MDGYDIYRKLIFGTSLDYSKRKRRKNNKNKKNKVSESDEESKTVQLNGSPQEHKDEPHINSEIGEVQKYKRQRTLSPSKLEQIRKEEARHFRRLHHILVDGTDIPDAIDSFEKLENLNIHSSILANIEKLGYNSPTPIQMQVIPLLLQKRQVLACAPTGSGKTAAFLIPIIHSLKGPQNVGFRALILAPTRELARQINQDCLKLCVGTNLRPFIFDKVKTLLKKPKLFTKHDILISTPNRLIYMLHHDPPLLNLDKLQWFVVDECDKLFEAGKQGFRDQLAEIYKACDSAFVKRAMFSATFSHEVEEWCKLNIDSVVSISIGSRNTAAETVNQEILFVGSESGKLVAFRDLIKKGLVPPVLVFVQSKERARELFTELIYDGINVDVIHADRTQLQRDNVVRSFRQGKIWVLICTELMGRGIDFKSVNLVVNYDFPPSSISYIHRIGRTGRAGRPGKAITYFTEDDVENLRNIAQVMKNAGCEVPDYMLQLKKKIKHTEKMKHVKRAQICTTPKYIVEKQTKLKKLIEHSKKRKFKNQIKNKTKKEK